MKRVLLWLLTLVCLAGVAEAKTIYLVNAVPYPDFDCWLYPGDKWANEIGDLKHLEEKINDFDVYELTTNYAHAIPCKHNWGGQSADLNLADIAEGSAFYLTGKDGENVPYASLEALKEAVENGGTLEPPTGELKEYPLMILGEYAGNANWAGTGFNQNFTSEVKDGQIVYTWTGSIDQGDENSMTKGFRFGCADLQLSFQTNANYGWGVTGDASGEIHDVTDTYNNGNGHCNMYMKAPFNGTIVITQTLENGQTKWTVDFKNGTVVDPTPEELFAYDLYLRGYINGVDSWDLYNSDRHMTLTKGETENTYTWSGEVTNGKLINFGSNAEYGTPEYIRLGVDYSCTGNEGNDIALVKEDGQNISWAMNARISVVIKQTAEGWTLSWKKIRDVEPTEPAVPVPSPGLDHSLNRYDLYIRGGVNTLDGEGWDGTNDRRKMHRVKVVNDKVDGYVYTWQGTIKNPTPGRDASGEICFGAPNSNAEGGFDIQLSLGETKTTLNENTYSGENELGREMTPCNGYQNIFFQGLEGMNPRPEIRITLTQLRDGDNAEGKWYMKWEQVARPANVEGEGGVYLHSSEFNEWDQSKRRAFKWNAKDGRYELALNFENSSIDVVAADGSTTSMSSTTLTNFFYIEAFGKTYSIEGGKANPIPTDTRVTLSSELGDLGPNKDEDPNRLARNMILEDQALEDAVLYYNPNTHQFRVTGKKSSNIDAGTYTIYYKITDDDMEGEGENKTLKDIRLWAWGNSEQDRETMSSSDFAGVSFPGISLNEKGTIVNVTDENGNVTSYIKYELDIPANNSTIGLIFTHGTETDNHGNYDQTKNYLDTEFQNGRIYQWNAVLENSVEQFFAKVALRVVDKAGNKALLLMETKDGEHYTLEGIDMNNFAKSAATNRYLQDFKDGVRLSDEELIRAEQANADDIKDYVGFYVVRTRNSDEFDDLFNVTNPPSIRDYRYYYTNNGGLAYWKTYDLDRTQGQMDHVNWDGSEWVYDNPTGNKATHDKMMTLNSEQVDGLRFKFELSNGNLTVERDEDLEWGTTERIVVYFHNVNNMKQPHILVESTKTGNVYTANNKVEKDGQIIELGEAMLHDDSRLNVDPTLWRYELRVPLHELNGTGIQSKGNWEDGIKPHNYEAASHLHFTFTDAAAPVAPQHNGKFLGSNVKKAAATEAGDMNNVNQLLNVPVVHGGIYSLAATENVPTETAGYIYLVNSEDNKIIGKLDQTASPDYIFESTLNIDDMGLTGDTLSVYVATSTSEDGVSADGVYYGAGSRPNDEVAQDMIDDTAKHSAEYAMTYNNSNPYVINIDELSNVNGYDGKLAVKVEINPTSHTGDIGFGINAQDIETGIGEVEDADAPVMWFNLQGVRLEAPVKGVNIRVQGRKSTKVFVTE